MSTLAVFGPFSVVGVAMSPHNLGGKYRCRPPTPVSKVHAPVFFPGTRACQTNCIRVASSLAWLQHRRSCGVFKSWISVAHYPFQRKWRVLHIRYISVLEQVGMSFYGLPFVQAGVPSCSDDVTHRWCANFKCKVTDVNNRIPIDFGAIKCILSESGRPCRHNISWYI